MALSDDLIAYWPMETPGAFSPDIVTGRHVLVRDGDANLTITTGKVGNATVFSQAADDQFIALDHTEIRTGDIDFTIACWVYMTSKTAIHDFVSKWSNTATLQEYLLGYTNSGDRMRFVVRNSTNTATASVTADVLGSPSINTWYFIVAWHDAAANTINIQINNGAVNSVSHTGGVQSTTNFMGIGGRGDGSSQLTGYLDEVGFWKRVLTAGEKTALYNSGAGITYPFSGETVPPVHAPGVWSWYLNPRAIWAGDKLYWAGHFYNNAGYVLAGERDDATGALNSSQFSPGFGSDDHAGISFLRRDSDGKILAAYTGHGTSYLYLAISSSADSVGAFAAPTNLDSSLGGSAYSYPTLIQLTGETNDPIYLFWREGSGPYDNYFSKSTDGGATWSAGTHFFDNGAERPYFVYAQNGNGRIDFACTDGHPASIATNSIYHFYYEGGNWYKSDGTLIGDNTVLPLEPADVTKVYDGTTVRSWTWDIAIDSNGYPVIVYATFPTAASDHRYRYARWTGSAWVDNEICAAGGPLYAGEVYYSGGVTVDKVDPSIVWASRKPGSQFEIYKYVTANNGTSWTETQITTGSADMQARPYCPPGKSMRPLWWTGTYTSYTSFDTRIIVPDVEAESTGRGWVFNSGIFGLIVR